MGYELRFDKASYRFNLTDDGERHRAWIKPWQNRGGAGGIPVNDTTKKEYQGINILTMWVTSQVKGYMSNAWGTFKQWSTAGEQVRKGEKGTLGVYWNIQEKTDKNNPDKTKKIPFLSSFDVFNKCQLQSYDLAKEELQEIKPIEHRIEAVDHFIKNTWAIIEHGGDVACYIPALDKIRMPHMSQFKDLPDCKASEAYYSTLFHETIHFTGHESRLNRGLSTSFKTEKYAKEELVAELGSSFLGAEFQIEKEPLQNHAAYIEGWMKRIKDEPGTFTTAASQASRAVAYLHSERQV